MSHFILLCVFNPSSVFAVLFTIFWCHKLSNSNFKTLTLTYKVHTIQRIHYSDRHIRFLFWAASNINLKTTRDIWEWRRRTQWWTTIWTIRNITQCMLIIWTLEVEILHPVQCLQLATAWATEVSHRILGNNRTNPSNSR